MNCLKKNAAASLRAVRVVLDTPVDTPIPERAFSEKQYLDTHFRVTESMKRAQYAVHKMPSILFKHVLDNDCSPESLIIRGFEHFFGKAAPKTLQSIFRFNQHTVCLCVPKEPGSQEKKLEIVTGRMINYTLFTRASKAIIDTLLIVKDLDSSWSDAIDAALRRLDTSAFDTTTWNDLVHSVDMSIFKKPNPILKSCIAEMLESIATLKDAAQSTRRVL